MGAVGGLMAELQPIADVVKNFGPLTALAGVALGWWIKRQERQVRALTAWKMYRDDIYGFANAVVDSLTEAEAICEMDPKRSPDDFWKKRSEVLNRLSALRDKGKFIIPNSQHNLDKSKRNDAFSGVREPMLDCVSAGFHVASAINFQDFGNNKTPAMLDNQSLGASHQLRNLHKGIIGFIQAKRQEVSADFVVGGPFGQGWSCKDAIIQIKREFVSLAQDTLNPRKYRTLIVEAAGMEARSSADAGTGIHPRPAVRRRRIEASSR